MEIVVAVDVVVGDMGAVASLFAVVCGAFVFLSGMCLAANSTGVSRFFAHVCCVSELVTFATLGGRAVCVICVNAALLVGDHQYAGAK